MVVSDRCHICLEQVGSKDPTVVLALAVRNWSALPGFLQERSSRQVLVGGNQITPQGVRCAPGGERVPTGSHPPPGNSRYGQQKGAVLRLNHHELALQRNRPA